MLYADPAGGSLVAVPASGLEEWSGVDGDDFDRACAVGFVGVIGFGQTRQALVLADEPLGTTYVSSVGLFIQWLAADPGTNVLGQVRSSIADASWAAGPVVEVPGPLVLFGAALPGRQVEVDRQARVDGEPRRYQEVAALWLDVVSGRYRVESADVDPDAHTRFRLHRLVPEPDTAR